MDVLSNKTKKEDIVAKLKGWLPWSISLYSLIKSGGALKIINDNNFKYIAALSRFHEWICYLEDASTLNELLNYIESYKEECRIIVFSKEKMLTNDLINQSGRKVKYHIEDFMILKKSIQSDSTDSLIATEKDIHELSLLQLDYCNEEVDWKYHKRTYEELIDTYKERIITSKIFVRGRPIVSKVEVVDIGDGYAKVSGVFTKTDMRNKGMAKLCLSDAVIWATRNNIKLCLNVRHDNIYAKKLYLDLGFVEMGEVLYYRPE